MVKRGVKKKSGRFKNNKHPIFKQKLTFGQRSADAIAKFGGSWSFIIVFFLFLISWMGVNSWLLITKSFDPYPFILLNLVLSCLAAIQAPVILMSQNRQTERDRIDANYDYKVNRLAEREIKNMQTDLDEIKMLIRKKV